MQTKCLHRMCSTPGAVRQPGRFSAVWIARAPDRTPHLRHAHTSSDRSNLRKSQAQLVARSCSDGREVSSGSDPSSDLVISYSGPAQQALKDCVRLLLARDFESLVPYLSLDAVIKAVVTRASKSSRPASTAPVCFLDVLECQTQHGEPHAALFDSYAIRHLVLNLPTALQPLSTLPVGGDRQVQRYLSKTVTGEACVLTFTIMRRPEHESRVQYSRMKVMSPWVLASVHGEPACLDPVERPAREHPPEAVLAAYLAAFSACDMDTAYRLTSPLGRAVAGGKSQFYNLLRYDPRYQTLLMHSRADSVRRCHSQARTYVEVVRASDASGVGRLFCFVATLQAPHTEFSNCWMVDYVSVIEDERLMGALDYQRGSASDY